MDMTQSRAGINAVVFASTVGFMGIGLVDPILVAIADGLNTTPSEVSLLFTSYFLITAVMMLITDIAATRIGLKNTTMLGAFVVALFALGSGNSNTVGQLVGYRSGWGWGLGNALFVATVLTLIVTLSQKKGKESVRLYEAALGVGIAIGPLVGALLGQGSWRYSFWGTALLMLIGFVSIACFVPATPVQRHSLAAPFQALKQPKLRLFRHTRVFPVCSSVWGTGNRGGLFWMEIGTGHHFNAHYPKMAKPTAPSFDYHPVSVGTRGSDAHYGLLCRARPL